MNIIPSSVRRTRTRLPSFPTLTCRTAFLGLAVGLFWTQLGAAAQVEVDLKETHQTVDGFGFFGGMDSWWGGPLISEEWAAFVVEDMGLSIWRNEYYPPADTISGQDADWEKQRPVVEGLRQAAEDAQSPLKFIFTVWSPPSSMKCAVSGDRTVTDGVPHTGGAKRGGSVCPSKREEFAAWLADGVALYESVGIDLYALSFQNEPLFVQDFNSCVYTSVDYATVLATVAPIVRASYPDVLFFGAENMLEIEAADENIPWFYSTAINDNPAALKELDIWAVHGYSDGVLPTDSSRMYALWSSFKSNFSGPSGKPVWMTETSGYNDSWNTPDGGDAMDLALAIYSALRHGDASAWIWWQGSGSVINEYSLMKGLDELSKRYYVHKHFSRFIRPGAKQVTVASDEDDLFVVGFKHDELDNVVLVAVNPTSEPKSLVLSGQGMPSEYDMFLTDAQSNCEDKGIVQGDSIELPAGSLVTLVSGSVHEADLPVVDPNDPDNGGTTEDQGETGETDSTSTGETDQGSNGGDGDGDGDPGSSTSGEGGGQTTTLTGADSGGAEPDEEKGGCGCRTTPGSGSGWWLLALAGIGVTRLRRRQG